MYVHGNNLIQKGEGDKYRDKESQEYLKEIKPVYEKWKKSNLDIIGPTSKELEGDLAIIEKRVKLLNEYKDFIDQKKYAEKFDSRSALHASVLEEFMYYLFKNLVSDYSPSALIGKAHTFKDVFFTSNNFSEMVREPHVMIEKKDHDFVIGVKILSQMNCEGYDVVERHEFEIPAIAIECKTYLDKTMLEGSSTAANELKRKNPNSKYIVVSEWLKLTEEINLKKYDVDQIYVLRKQKNTDRDVRLEPGYVKNPIYADVVFHLFTYVRTSLNYDAETGIAKGLERGYLIK